jgi:hypothetical protein
MKSKPRLAQRLVLRLASDTAGVDNDGVGLRLTADLNVADRLQQGGDRFGIADIHLASIGVKQKLHGSTISLGVSTLSWSASGPVTVPTMR